MSLSFSNYVNCFLIFDLPNNLTTVSQGGIPVKLHNFSYTRVNHFKT